jgi:hypothetical protein
MHIVGRVWFCIVKRKLALGSLKRMMRPAAVQACRPLIAVVGLGNPELHDRPCLGWCYWCVLFNKTDFRAQYCTCGGTSSVVVSRIYIWITWRWSLSVHWRFRSTRDTAATSRTLMMRIAHSPIKRPDQKRSTVLRWFHPLGIITSFTRISHGTW